MNRKHLAAVLCGGILVGAVWYSGTHVRVGGQFYSRNLSSLDLTGKAITPKQYEALQAALPDCDITWLVPFQNQKVNPDSTQLTISELNAADLELLAYFPRLTRIDARQCRDYAALTALRAQYPGLSVVSSVDIGGQTYDGDCTEISVRDPDPRELMQQLPLFTSLHQVNLTGTLPEAEALLSLCDSFPELDFCWTVTFGERSLPNTTDTLDLSGQEVNTAELRAALSLLPSLHSVDLRETKLEEDVLKALADDYPDVFFLWNLQIGKFSVPTDSVEIDLTGHPLNSPQEIEALLPYLPNAKTIILSKCGLEDETLDALNQRHPEVKIVWSVFIKNRYIRTDTKWFYPFKFHKRMTVNNQDLYPLRYCTDMEWIDIGHMFEVTDCEWARFMPNLTWLIIGETGISDLSPLSGCKKLKYLELFTIPVTDYTPLLECTAMEYLNLGRTYGSPEPIAKMTWLKHLWWCEAYGKHEITDPARVEPVDNMIAALPNTEIKIKGLQHPTDLGWRKLDGYYEMRDYLGLFYLP